MTTASIVTAALGTQRLTDLTNEGPASSVDTDVLAAAATMAEGEFRVKTGIEPDSDLDWHNTALIAGTVWALEFNKGRGGGSVDVLEKKFNFACLAIRRIATMAPQTSSVLTPSVEKSTSRPDMDRQEPIIKGLTEGRPLTGGITDFSPDT